MSLSLSKLIGFLSSKSYIPIQYFGEDDFCVFINIMCLTSYDNFMIYIPSKYEFNLDKIKDSFKISEIELKRNKNNNFYKNIQIDIKEGDVEKELVNNYKHEIILKNVPEQDNEDLIMIYKQLDRLKNCVENLKYKLCIQYKNYMCCIRRSNEISIFTIDKYNGKNMMNMSIIVDLETLYEKIDTLPLDMETVKSNIYEIFENTQNNSNNTILKMISDRNFISSVPENIQERKYKYDHLLLETHKLAIILDEKEASLMEDIQNLEKIATYSIDGDIIKAREKSKIETTLKNIRGSKINLAKTIVELRNKKENLILGLDNILFENAVLLDNLSNNFKKLSNFVK